MQTQDRVAEGIATARSGQRLAGRAHLERAREAGGDDPAHLMWLAWTARSPEQAAEHLQALLSDPAFAGVARAGLLWMEALIEGADAVRGKTLADPLAVVPSRPTTKPATASVYRVVCARCRARLEVHSTALGNLRECPACQEWFVVSRAGGNIVPVAEAGPSSGPKVLLIDDNAAIRRMAEAALTDAGYSVETAAGAHEALERVRHSTPELVLLDAHLADADGYDVCRALRLFPSLRTVPIVLLTGNDGGYDAKRGRAAGATEALAKPCTTRALLARVRAHLPDFLTEER